MKKLLGVLALLLCAAVSTLQAAQQVVISEFMAANSRTVADEDGNYEDWIEVMNVGAAAVNLLNWSLTDEAANPAKWRFPSVTIAPNGTLLVFASNKNRRAAGRPLHTNFKLSNTGEYLALVRSDGSIATQFAPVFPRQAADVSYGLAIQQTPLPLVAPGSPARVLVPANDAQGSNWVLNGFDDAAWRHATNGLGFQRSEPPVAPSGLVADSLAEFSGTQGQNNWFYGYWDRGGDADGVYAPSEFIAFAREPGNNTVGPNNAWDGGKWDLVAGAGPWTELGNSYGHPNKEPQWQYAIRRWVSPVNGLVRLAGYLSDGGECGDGQDLKIFVDGQQVHTATTYGSTAEFGLSVNVAAGSRVDFAVGPNTANDWCDGFNFAVRILQGALADSMEDWSSTGQQGSRGWSYGYYDKASDSDGAYQATNFTLFTPAQWIGGKWDVVLNAAPWTELNNTGGHPASGPGEQWAIRRWTSSYEGSVLLSCRLSHQGSCGGGTMARIFKDGQQVYERAVARAATAFWTPLEVSAGTVLDFAIDPNGDDGCDGTTFLVQVQEARAGVMLLADSEAGWVGGAQGANNWYYGYYDKGADADGVYNPLTDYRDSRTDSGWVFEGQWHRTPAWPPWTSMGPTWGHPNGYNSPGGENWAVQRWVSPVSGPVSIAWSHRKPNSAGGTTITVYKNNQRLGSTVVGGDFTGLNQIVSTVVASNDIIDFALSPLAPDGSLEDWSDATDFKTVIFGVGAVSDGAVNTLAADSIADWSAAGEQGYKGWFYGLYNKSGDADGVYQASEFVSANADWTFTGSQWELGFEGAPYASPPWNNLTQYAGHPNGTNNGAEVWSIRRWMSTFSGPATITWRMAMASGCAGGGTSVRVFHNGVQVDFGAIAGNDTTGLTRSIVVPALAVGDAIDIALTPTGADNTGQDGCDSTAFSASIYRRDTFASHFNTDLGDGMFASNATVYARFAFTVADPAALSFLKLRLRYDDGFVAYLNGVEVARRNAPSYQPGGLMANSMSEFSATQGANQWFNGYYDKTADLNGIYEPGDFATVGGWNWTGWGWVVGGYPPWTQLDAFYSHPNGANSGHEQWPVRRWVCETAGSLRINLRGRKQNANCGNGVTFRVFHNGAPIYARVVEYWDTTGFTTNLTVAEAQVGDLFDVALDSTGTDGVAHDACDGSEFAVTIDQEPMPALAWNSRATSARPSALSLVQEEFDLSPFLSVLSAGNNVLAIQGLNASAVDLDFLLDAELTATTVALQSNALVYFTEPTPGQVNNLGTTTLGPLVSDVTATPQQPFGTNDLLVTARSTAMLNPVSSLALRYRVMYGPERELPMYDDGSHGDGAAGDGVWGATIPAASAATAGQMIRWHIVSADSAGSLSREPAFLDHANSPEYYGTMVADPAVVTALPVLYWFVQNPAAANNFTGTRCSIFYDGQFYDNIEARMHGQSTTGFPKKSYNFDLNRGAHLRYAAGQPDLEEFVLFSTYADKTHLRNVLAFDTYADTGVPAHFAFPIRVQQNGQFHSLANFAENANSRFLERLGMDPNGVLYKLYTTLNSSTSGVEKKTRRSEDNSDLQTLINKLNQSDVTLRKNFMFDSLDVAEIVNYMATRSPLNGDQDWGHKNYYLYRDTLGSGEWQAFPQDVDLSFGHNWTCNTPCLAYFDDTIYTNSDFYAGYNVLFDQFKYLEPFRTMWLRRVRTLMDTVLQAPGVAPSSDRLQARIHQYASLIAPDAALDLALWNPSWGSGAQTLPQALARIDASSPESYLAGRRAFLFNTLSVDNGGPIPRAQSGGLALAFGAVDYSPASTNQDQEYVQLVNPNAEALDISGWHVEGGIQHTFRPGTVLPVGASIYLAKDVAAFRARTASPKGNEQRFVQGNYQGRLSARGETLVVRDLAGQTNVAMAYAGAPSLAQRFLRVTELMFNPSPLAGSAADPQDFEYIELKNTSPSETLSLAGVRFTAGVQFDFGGSAVTSLAPGARVLVVKNAAAFAARYGGGSNVAGAYADSLDNAGERITLLDAANEEILDFTYSDGWYPMADGAGFSLVIADEAAEPDAWNWKSQWRPSGVEAGSPGAVDAALPGVPAIRINEALTHTDPPMTDTIELYNPTAASVDVGGWFLTDNFALPKKFRIPSPTVIAAGGYVTFSETNYNSGGTGFAFSSIGEEVYLFSGDARGNLTGYFHGFAFGPAANGVAFGRYVPSTGEEHFVAESSNTLGSANARPRVGPLVFNQIMYHPPDLGGADNTVHEYLQFLNISREALPLYDTNQPANTWRIRGGADFDFPAGVSLPPNGLLLVVSFDPVRDLAAAAGFRAQYSLSASVALYGPYSGKLANVGETLRIERPDAPNGTNVPYIVVEAVKYSDGSSWPAGADGLGQALQRLMPLAYGNDPVNWSAAAPAPGLVLPANRPPVVRYYSAQIRQNQALVLPAERLLNCASDPDGDALSVSALATATARGGAVVFTNNVLAYMPALNYLGADAFSYQVHDGLGGSTSVEVTVTVLSTNAGSLNIVLGPRVEGANFRVKFAGIPRQTYQIDFATGVAGPWIPRTNITAGANGIFELLDPISEPAPPACFYRARTP